MMQINSRGWFEDDESFSQRVDMCNAESSVKNKQSAKKGKKPATASSSSSSKSAWVANTSTKSKPNSMATGVGTKKSKGGKGTGGVFAAMMLNDSDSD
jgi:ribulose 1,5-bisphosphate synthetase/thiazole synthase